MTAEPVLEFEALRALLARYVRTPLGLAELASVAPGSDRAAIESALADVAEAIEHARTVSQPQPASRGAAIRVRFELGADPRPAVARLAIEGATLDAAEIYELTRLLDLAADARAVLLPARERFPRLAAHASALADLRDLARQLRGKILPDGSLADDASVALGKLRRDAEKQRRLIEESLARFLRAHHEDGTLQEDFVTIRNDRFVVPIVTGRERRVDGVIHGSSGSGHTMFVEPLETIHLNNELVRIHEEELREVHRLLREFTSRLREHAREISAMAEVLGRLELLFAKAEFAAEFRCCVPRLSSPATRRLALREARHPLLEDILRPKRKPVVPVSLSLGNSPAQRSPTQPDGPEFLTVREAEPALRGLEGNSPAQPSLTQPDGREFLTDREAEPALRGLGGNSPAQPSLTRADGPEFLTRGLEGEQRTLLISGPNTGGKTVALKTVGLLALMAHAGLPVPAAEAEFPLFDRVLADIGDHQSLQESLSSFSAHIGAIRSMLERATPDSLVLLDELGRATDPEEGGALGVVLLETFRARGAFTLASTHLMAMKVYGASTPGVLNGSMGFDEETLEPTYVLRLGAPGKSAGLDIAARLGLSADVIEAARERMTNAERDVSRFLAELHKQMAAIEEERASVAAREQAVEARERSLEQTLERKYSARTAEIERRAAELSSEFERRAQETLGELSQKARAKVAKTRREYQEAVGAVAKVAGAPVSSTPASTALAEGVRVRLKGIRQPATVRRLLSNDLLEVDAGFMRMRVTAADIEEVLPAAGAPARTHGQSTGISFRQGPTFETSYREINLIGQRAEQACEQVEKFLDSATLAQVERVRIVHGHGMGVLKKAVADVLKNSPYVEKFYAAPPEEGGSGATIAELK
jgi:DNA mismatch repair protein MutS2